MNQTDRLTAATHPPLDEAKLKDVIRLLEARIRELDAGGESAYEKALIRSYELTLNNYRMRLATLRAA